MRVSNQSPAPVDWEQNGSGPAPETSQGGQLQSGQATGDFTPSGEAPYTVKFTNVNKPTQTVASCKFSDPDATVTLNDNWTVTVSTGCD